jgi:ribosomal protein S18 acetylase RimI-like enzyme
MLHIRRMTVADLPLGMRLKEQAGWNQTEADWRRFLAIEPEGCFVAKLDGNPVGTAVGCVFGAVAWLAMVLVDTAVRGRGIGRALVKHALAFVEQHGATSVRLDATPHGQPLYEKLGFAPQFALTRYAGMVEAGWNAEHEVKSDSARTTTFVVRPRGSRRADSGRATHGLLRAAQPDDYDAMLTLDRSTTNTNRRKFLIRLFEEHADEVRVAEQDGLIEGYVAVRHGSDAVQLGPCVASPVAGSRLLGDACSRFVRRRVYLDIPSSNTAAVRIAESSGLTAQRTLLRMCRGVVTNDDCARLWASSGPELG